MDLEPKKQRKIQTQELENATLHLEPKKQRKQRKTEERENATWDLEPKNHRKGTEKEKNSKMQPETWRQKAKTNKRKRKEI